MPTRLNAGMSIALFALLVLTLVAPGCDSFTGMVPTEDADHPDMVDATKRAPSVGESVSGSGDTGMHAAGPMPGPGQMDMPDSDGVEMANMMMNAGELAIPDDAPDDFDSTTDFAAQLGTAIPGDDAPDAVTGTDAYFNQPGGIGLDPAVGDGAPGDLGTANDEYLQSFGGNQAGGPGGAADAPGLSGPRPQGKARNKPPSGPPPSAIGTKLRSRGPGNPAAQKPSSTRPGTAPKPSTSGNTAPPGFPQQPLFHLTNPVSLYDGTGFSIGFSVDYQLLRAPEPGVSYLWVVSFEELDKSGRGSSVRKVQQTIRPSDSGSGTLKVVVPLKGQPKEPYRCVIAAKKGNQQKQVSKSTTFPPSFK